MGPESDKYRLSVSGFSGDTDDALAAPNDPNAINNGMQFSTKDQDNDMKSNGPCLYFGWWFNNCSRSRLNARNKAYWNASAMVKSVTLARMMVNFD